MMYFMELTMSSTVRVDSEEGRSRPSFLLIL